MFERYTEKARRVIFFARYEASQFGSSHIETEHVLLGILREDKRLAHRFLRSYASFESIRKQIEAHTAIGEKVSTSVDLPLTDECTRVLAYAAEEAGQLGHKQIGTEHLFLGLLREERSFAAEILHERGLRLSSIREELARGGESPATDVGPDAPTLVLVSISSVPAGADIEVDGVFLGHTPAELPLPIGERMVTISKAAYQPWQRELQVLSGGKQTLSVELGRVPE